MIMFSWRSDDPADDFTGEKMNKHINGHVVQSHC